MSTETVLIDVYFKQWNYNYLNIYNSNFYSIYYQFQMFQALISQIYIV